MQKHLFYSAAFIAVLTCAGMPAHAQDYAAAKGDANLLQDSRRMDYSEPAAPAAQDTRAMESTRRIENTQSVTHVEPQSGHEDKGYADFTGFYAGADVGYAVGSYDVNDPVGPDGDVGLDGFNGSLFLGYGFEHSFNWLGGYAGLEIAHEWSGTDGDIGGVEYEKDDAWLVTFRPGVSMYQDALAYGIIGYSRAEFESPTSDEDIDGLVLGAGAEFDTNTPFKTRLEYTFTNYGDDDLGGVDFDGHENNIKLGAVFAFN